MAKDENSFPGKEKQDTLEADLLSKCSFLEFFPVYPPGFRKNTYFRY
jgi:hypothetical protein